MTKKIETGDIFKVKVVGLEQAYVTGPVEFAVRFELEVLEGAMKGVKLGCWCSSEYLVKTKEEK